MYINDLVKALAFAGTTLTDSCANFDTNTTVLSCTPSKQGLWSSMQVRNRTWIGTALTVRNDTNETAIISHKLDFNSMTPENAMKFDATEPARNNFTFAASDAHVDYATSRGYQIHCHNLVWYSQLPTWVTSGNFDNATLISIMKNHIDTVAGRYKGRCTRWDVVNEALEEDGTYRNSTWYTTIGESYIPMAFAMARAADPTAKLFYNDYNFEFAGAKFEGSQRIVKLIQSYGVEIDGVGLQAHLTSEGTPSSGGGVTPDQSTLETVLRNFTSMDVDVAYTEVDVRFVPPANVTQLAEQRAAYERIAASCLAVERCVGMTTWGVTDKYSWIPATFPGEGDALMWDANYTKKPAYYGFLEGIQTGGK